MRGEETLSDASGNFFNGRAATGMFQGVFRTAVEYGDLFRREFVAELVTKLLEHFALFFKRKPLPLR